MAAVKARLRRRRRFYYYEPPKPKRQGTPRLATIQLEGVFGPSAAPARGSPQNFRGVGVFVALGAAAAIAGAAWIGGSLFDLREAAAMAANQAALSMGLEVEKIDVVGARGARAEEVRAVIADAGGAISLFAAAPSVLKARVESLDWVGSARVRRIWPSTLRIEIERRNAFARWQENGAVSVVDRAGERLFAERPADNLDLPLVVGEGAGPAAAPLLVALEHLPLTRERTRALVRIADRRWNLRLDSGATVALPEEDPERALRRLETLQARYALLDRPVQRIDLRLGNRVAVRVHPPLAGAPNGQERAA